MTYHLKGKDNKGGIAAVQLSADKRLTARKLVDELNKRIDSGQLSDVSTELLIQFLGKTLPKEVSGTVDHVINYISNVPANQLNHDTANVIDITPEQGGT